MTQLHTPEIIGITVAVLVSLLIGFILAVLVLRRVTTWLEAMKTMKVITALRRTIKTLQNENVLLKERNTELRKQNDMLRERIQLHEERIEDLSEAYEKTRKDIKAYDFLFSKQKDLTAKLQKDVRQLLIERDDFEDTVCEFLEATGSAKAQDVRSFFNKKRKDRKNEQSN